MKTVLLIEDDPRVRLVIKSLLLHGAYRLVGEAGTLAEGRALLRRHQPDVLLLDLGLPDGDGLAILREHAEGSTPGAATRSPPSTMVALVLTVFDDDEHVFDALRAGAAGYLLKDDVVQKLLPGLDELAAGGAPMSPPIARRVLRSFANPVTATPEAGEPTLLTPREREVTALLARGATYDEIGRALSITTNTVRTYIRSIYEKLHVCSKTEAVMEALRLGVVSKP